MAPGIVPFGLSKREDYNPGSTDKDKKKGSLLRLLSPRPSSSSKSDIPSLVLHVADYGSILIQTSDRENDTRPPPSRQNSHSGTSTPRGEEYVVPPSQIHEYELAGTLEITMPPHLGKRRVKAIRIGMDATTRLDMGKTRGWEEDTIFKRKLEIRGADRAGIILEPGTQLFSFSLFLPDDMPVHDWHPNAYCGVTLYGEIEGFVERPPPSSSRSRSRTPFSVSPTSIPGTPTAGGSRSTSPAPRRAQSSIGPVRARQTSMETTTRNGQTQYLDSVMNRLEEISIARDSAMPQVPAYPDGNGSKAELESLPWLHGVHRTDKPFEILYNPNPTGGLTDLAMSILGDQSGLGGYRLEIMSEIFTICAAVHVRLTLPTPPLTTTIYAFRLVLAQTVSLYSPRDPPDIEPTCTTRNFSIIDHGQIPPRGAEGEGIPTLWRGLDAGGTDFEEMSIDMHGRLPDDEKCRPTSVPQMKSPLRLSHQFIAEIFFSVHGEDDRGRKRPGGGGLRFLRMSKPVVVPSCAMIPMWLLPPEYEESPSQHPPGPCPHRPLDPDWAKDAAQYKPDLECALCRAGVPPSTRPGWRDCACGNRGEDLEERGRRLNEAPMLPTKYTAAGESLAEREDKADGRVNNGGQEERRGRRGARE